MATTPRPRPIASLPGLAAGRWQLRTYRGRRVEAAGAASASANSCQLPLTPFNWMGPAVLQGEVGADHQVVDGPGGKDFTRSGRRHDPGRDVHGDAADVAVAQLDLAGMDSGTELEPHAA
jgi:hypothetical protein